jgi:hypothetical protein
MKKARTVALDRLDITCVSSGWTPARWNKSLDGNTLSIAGKKYRKGMGTHAPSKMVINLHGEAVRFNAKVGLDDEMRGGVGTVEFVVSVDGREPWKSGVMRSGDRTKQVDVPLDGASIITLEVTDAGDGIDADHGDWVDAVISTRGPDPVAVNWEADEAVDALKLLRRLQLGRVEMDQKGAMKLIQRIEGLYSRLGEGETRIRPLLESIRLTGDLPPAMQEAYAYASTVGAGTGTRTVWLDEFGANGFTSGWGAAQVNKSVEGNPLRIGGTEFARGIGTHAASRFTVDLGGETDRFSAVVGVDDEQDTPNASVVFNVIGDGKVLWTSGVVRAADRGRALDVDLKGVRELTLEVTGAGDGIGNDHADWADAKLVVSGRAPVVTAPRRDPDARYTEAGWKQPLERLALTWEDRLAMDEAPEKCVATRASDFFPGRVPADLPRVTETLVVDLARPFWHSTGLYAAPGDKVTVTIPRGMAGKGLSVRIGCHTDTLWHLEDLSRAPEISKAFPLKAVRTVIANPFGGLVYIVVPGRENRKRVDSPDMFNWTVTPIVSKPTPVKLVISGAVKAPVFRLTLDDNEKWKTIRNISVPFGELEGRRIILQIPQPMLAKLDDPLEVIEFWDEVMVHQARLAGWDENQLFPMYFTLDRQISAGGGHSGYPIMAYPDWGNELLQIERVRREGGWGTYHELGHNHQQWSGWTFQDQVEVTCNLFSLYCNMKMSGWKIALTDAKPTDDWKRVTSREWHMETLKKFFSRDPGVPGKWKEADLDHRLGFYVELVDAFGWDPIIKVIRSYHDNPKYPSDETGQGGEYMVRLSRIVGRNLYPFFFGWGIEMPRGVESKVKDLPAWMPAYINNL